MCQDDFYVPIHQGRTEKAILAPTSLAAGCCCIRGGPEATMSVEMMLTGGTGRNASALLTLVFLHRCSGSRTLWRQMFAVHCNLVHVVRSRHWLLTEKRWGRLNVSQRTGSHPCSALTPVQAPRKDVAGPLPSAHWAQIGAWGLKRNDASWGAMNSWACIYGILRIQLEHSGGTLKAANKNIGRCIKIGLFA